MQTTRLMGSVVVVTVACRLAVDPGITYRTCERGPYVELFADGTTLENLEERCWDIDRSVTDDVVLDGGDLVIRVGAPQGDVSSHWNGGTRGPTVYQSFDGAFVAVARVEARSQVTGDHCLAPGNAAGFVVLQTEPTLAWTTFLVEPFVPDPNPGLACAEEAELGLPTKATISSRDGTWGADFVERGVDQGGIGSGGVVEIAVCRSDGELRFYHRDPSSTEAPGWNEIGGESFSHTIGMGPVDVGLTASGAAPSFEVEGHFAWVVQLDGVGMDGCIDELESLELPGEEQ